MALKKKVPAPEPDDKTISALVKKALKQVGPYSYAGVSFRDLQRYQHFKEDDLELTREDIQLTQLYAGLSVLSSAYYQEKDLDRQRYQEVLQEVHNEDVKRYPATAFPYTNTSASPQLVEIQTIHKLLREELSLDNPGLQILKHPEIRHEWTVKPGKKIFVKFLKKINRWIKKFVCRKDSGLLSKFQNGGDEKDIIKELAIYILPLLGISGKFLSIGVLLATILVTRGLGLYCAGYETTSDKKK